ncbi:protein MIS12 homolog [Engraulis encrasicolus]|uniref:protein MIS12 homolog n=1 Tax=Engraulis encrasicolus TaxID=184585 RepID=UPI002FD23948
MDERAEKSESESLKLYEAQFFGFTPQTCMLRIYSAFHDGLFELMSLVESVFKRQLTPAGQEPSPEFNARTAKSSDKFLKFLHGRFELLYKRMESLLLDKVLSVPPNVLLPESECQGKYPRAPADLQRLEASLAQLSLAYQAEVAARQEMEAELEHQRQVKERLAGLLSWVEEVKERSTQEGSTPRHHDDLGLDLEMVRHMRDVNSKMLKKGRELGVLQ